MKLSMKKTIISIVLIVALLAVGGLLAGKALLGKKVNVSWYSDEQTEFVIETADQLYELVEISEKRDLKGKTFKLGADIVVNEGNASEWKDNAPNQKWYPIKDFAGTFDGQGHTISGLYGSVYDKAMGLFINTKPSAVIKDFKLVNTYLKAIGSPGTAAIAGGTKNSGNFEKIYTDAMIDCDGIYTAGIVSYVTGGDTTISECWFDGSITRYYYNHTGGGIAAQVNAATLNIEHCLNSGTIVNDEVQTYARVGGICGVIGSAGILNVTDCLSTGVIESVSSKQVGSIVGFVGTTSAANFKAVFATTESYSAKVGGNGDRAKGGVIQFDQADILGLDAYRWTNLDFENYWTVKEEDTPVLQCFAEQIVSTEGVERILDTSWFTGKDSEYTLTTKGQLYGLAYLSASEEFKGITVKLGADIVVNEGNAKKWSKEAPENPWIPISSWEGTFDGQGHTISGIYLNGGGMMGLFQTTKNNSVVKNLRLTNSYYKNNSTSNAYTGGVAGSAAGEFNTIYSDVIIESTGIGAGGIVGYLGSGTPKIINCWFDGQIRMLGDTGNSAGGILGYATVGCSIEHCLNTADLSAQRTDNYTRIGGICGVVGSEAILTIKDCLNTGHIESNKWQAGSIIGFIGTKASAKLDTVCTTNESYVVAVGGGVAGCNGMPIQYYEEDLIGTGGYEWTNLDFKNYWAIVKNRTPILKSFATSSLSTKGLQRKFDISWYSKNNKSFTITDAQDLYGVSILTGAGESFEGKTIKIGADIVVNAGDASTWASNPPNDIWIPIANFLGTFDGQGHTISGLYKNDGTNIGLFATTTDKTVIKNLCVENSYFANKQTTENVYIGGIVGQGGGTFDTVYSDVIIETTGIGVGGMIGLVNIEKTTMKNCWFAGEVNLLGEKANSAGGMAGIIQKNTTIQTCLNSGILSAETTTGYTRTAGFVGVIGSKAVVTMKDSLNVGTITGIMRQKGSMIGFIGSTATANLDTDVYATVESCSSIVGGKTGTLNSSANKISESKIKGDKAKTNASGLDFDTYWMILSKRTPILKSFAAKAPAIVSKGMTPDTSWYNKTDKEFTITTAAQLYGVEELSYDTDFAGITIKLGKNIKINEGNASTWGDVAPQYVWYPIQSFAGTFDGQGYEISGLYHIDGKNTGFFNETTASSVIKNLCLVNSYFANTTAVDIVHIGSVAGHGGGTFDTIYSDAIIVTTGQGVGGIIGNAEISGTTINNCWFNGNISLKGEDAYSGGGMVGIAANNVTLTNCLNSASISAERKNAYNRLGGMVGVASGTTVITMGDCLNVGTITRGAKEEVVSKQVGSIIGYIGAKAKANADGVYATVESYEIAIGSGKVNGDIVVAANEKFVSKNAFTTASGLDYKTIWAAIEGKTPILRSFLENETVVEEEKYDTSWYTTTEAGATFDITTESQLFGLAELSKTYDFAGQTIYLADDIPVSSEKVWTPIGSEVPFAGTFTGEYPKDSRNVHEISGLMVESGVNIGLFAQTTKDSVISHIEVLDSRFVNETANGEVNIGSIVGKGGGTLDTIYSEVIIVTSGQGVGGIIGNANIAGTTINDCWYKGNISLKGENAYSGGGMVGIAANNVTLTNCLNSAPISSERTTGYNRLGGMVGVAGGTTVVTMEDCLNVGIITPGRDQQVGSIIGLLGTSAKASVDGVYATVESYEKTINGGTVTGEITTAANEKFVGAGAYTTADKLDYTTYWTAIVGETPVLQSFKGDGTVAEKPSAPVDPQPPAGPIEITAYKENQTATEFVIKNVEQLYTFAELSKSYTFEEQKIYLDTNLTVNQGTANELLAKAKDSNPTNDPRVWTPIGTSEKPFKGTFNGQGHRINGLYYKSDTGTHIGLFGYTAACCTIKDFELRDCYFEGKAYIGGVAGQGGGTFSDIYSKVTITCSAQYAGGIIGYVDATINSTTEKNLISNCQFDGSILGTKKAVASSLGTEAGGIAGRVNGVPLTIQHCLNSGNIESKIASSYARIGGMCGTLGGTTCTVTISDSLNVGIITAPQTATQQRAIVAFKGGNVTLIVNDVYALEGSAVDFHQTLTQPSSSTNSQFIEVDKLKGDAFKDNTTLSEEYWVAQSIGTPILKKFYLYNPEKTELVIDNVEELYEFSVVASKYDLTGKTFYLGDTITVNQGTASELLAKATDSNPTNDPRVWTPIGTSEKPFKGTFDGQGHSINGLYYKSDTGTHIGLFGYTAACCTIKDFELKDCYFEGKSYIGGVAGQGGGTFTDIYSKVTITCSAQYAGGIIAYVDAAISNLTTERNFISNCQFDGSILGTKQAVAGGLGTEAGGIVGRVNGVPLTIQHCLNSGDIESRIEASTSGKYARIGGVCGTVASKSTVTISDCLNVGTIIAQTGTTQNAAIVALKGGSGATAATLDLNDVYALDGSSGTFNQAATSTNTTNSEIVCGFIVADKLKGDAFKTYTTLSYDKGDNTEYYWVTGTDYPTLKTFAPEPPTQQTAVMSFFSRAVAVVANLFD